MMWRVYTTGWRGYALTLLAGMVLALALVVGAIVVDDWLWVHQQHGQYRIAIAKQLAAKPAPAAANPAPVGAKP